MERFQRNLTGGADPAENGVFFLSALYDAPEIPGLVKKVMMPLAYSIGKLTGRYRKFHQAPPPL